MDLDSLKKLIADISSKAKSSFETALTETDLEDKFRSFLGKKGEVNLLLKSLGSLPPR